MLYFTHPKISYLNIKSFGEAERRKTSVQIYIELYRYDDRKTFSISHTSLSSTFFQDINSFYRKYFRQHFSVLSIYQLIITYNVWVCACFRILVLCFCLHYKFMLYFMLHIASIFLNVYVSNILKLIVRITQLSTCNN